MRARVQRYLNIKGEIAFPQNIDMRAIIPVYDLSIPPISELLNLPGSFGNINLAGVGPVYVGIIDNPYLATIGREFPTSIVIESMNGRLYSDAAGRLAMAGDTIVIEMQLSQDNGLNYTIYATWKFECLAAVVGPLEFQFGSANGSESEFYQFGVLGHVVRDGRSSWPFPDWRNSYYLRLSIALLSGGLFPANTFVIVQPWGRLIY
jgi:hypothetical protein